MRALIHRLTLPGVTLLFALHVPASAQPRTSDKSGSATLRRAVAQWISVQRDAYRRGDAAAFQPCADSNAIVLRDVDQVDHRCIDVQRHMRERVGGTLDIQVDSVWVRGDSGVIVNTLHFHRRIQRDGAWQTRDIMAWHRDDWRRVAGRWTLVRMMETRPQQMLIDGKAAPGASADGAEDDVAAVRRVEEEIIAAENSDDVAAFERLLAPDWTFVPPGGAIFDKARYLRLIRTDSLHSQSYTADSMSIRVYGTAAVVIYRSSVVGTLAGRDITSHRRRTTMLVKRDGRWLVVAQESTPIDRAPR